MVLGKNFIASEMPQNWKLKWGLIIVDCPFQGGSRVCGKGRGSPLQSHQRPKAAPKNARVGGPPFQTTYFNNRFMIIIKCLFHETVV